MSQGEVLEAQQMRGHQRRALSHQLGESEWRSRHNRQDDT